MPSNQHILEYLKYYAAFSQAPRFAVLINGRWGIGKTHLVQALCERIETTEFKPVYVSLNGLKSNAEIDRELFRVMHTVLGSRFFEAALSLGKTGLKAFKGATVDVDIFSLVNRYTADLYVFDDLERCAMPAVQVLGYINAFVEHGGRKVVVVANEAEIGDEAEYRRTREKVVGMVLACQSAADDALAAFLEGIRSKPARKFFATKVDVIRAIHDQAGLDNLRILQQALWDFERFFAALEGRHRADDAAMTAMLRFVLALSMEVRSGRLTRDDLHKRQEVMIRALMALDKDAGTAPFLDARRRYAGADLDSTALTDETVVALLVDGVVDEDAIRRDLNASAFFVNVADEPPWRTLWHGLQRTDAEVAAAQAAVEAAFAARAYTVPGEILHVFGLRLRLAEVGALPLTPQDVAAECRVYIDDLYAQGRLESATVDGGGAAMRETGYDGLGIVCSQTPEFKGLFALLEAKRAQAATDGYPALAAGLLDLLATAPDRFIADIAPGMGRESRVARIPALEKIDPAAFVAALAGLRPDAQRRVLDALKARYDHGMLGRELAPELPWAQAVRARLAGSMAAMPPYGRFRMGVFLERSFGEVPELTPPAPQPTPQPAPAAVPPPPRSRSRSGASRQ